MTKTPRSPPIVSSPFPPHSGAGDPAKDACLLERFEKTGDSADVDGKTPLRQFFLEVYRPRKLPWASEATIAHYRATFNVFDRFLDRPALLADLTDGTVTRFLTWYAEGRAPHSVQSAAKQLLAVWRYAAAHQLGPSAPGILVRSPPRENLQSWSEEELRRLLHAAERFVPYHKIQAVKFYGGIAPGAWWTGFLRFALDTAFRLRAILLMEWPDIDLGRQQALARAAHQNSRRAEVRPFSFETKAALLAIRAFRGGPAVFPWSADEGTFYNHLRRILQQAGLPHGRRDKCQRLRRTTAAFVAAALGSAVATEVLGHTASWVTHESYLDRHYVRPLDYLNALPRIDGLFNRNDVSLGDPVAGPLGKIVSVTQGPEPIDAPKDRLTPENAVTTIVVGAK